MWTFILTVLAIVVPVSVVLWILFSVLTDHDVSSSTFVIIGVICGLLLGAAVPGLLQSGLYDELSDDVGNNVMLALCSPLAIIQEITEEIDYYNAGHQGLWRLICAISYFLVPIIVGAVIGGFGGVFLADECMDGWPLLLCVAGAVLGVAVCGFLSMMVVGIIDFVTRKEFWEGVLQAVLGVVVVATLLGGGGTIIVAIFEG